MIYVHGRVRNRPIYTSPSSFSEVHVYWTIPDTALFEPACTYYISKEHFNPRQCASNGNEGAIHF